MTGRRHMFQSLELKPGGHVGFGGNQRGKIIGSGTVGNGNLPSINNVLLVDGLMHNLLSISQLSDNGYDIIFNQKSCKAVSQKDGTILFNGKRKNNIYKIKLSELKSQNVKCLLSVNNEQWIWHRRLGHVSMRRISQINKLNLVRGLPNLKFNSDALCEACQKGKFAKPSFKSKNVVSTSKPLELLHIDLFGPVKTASVSGKKYGLVIVDDYSRWTWVKFLRHKDESHSVFVTFCNQVQNEKDLRIVKVRSDHGGEFENKDFESFFNDRGILHDFSCPRTPQQNGVVERKNRTLQEMARTMINETNVAKIFWAEAINTACYIQNRISIRPILEKTPYELWKNRKPNISYFHPFGCTCFMLNTKNYLNKFDSKAQKCIMLGYSEHSRGYIVYNTETQIVEESISVRFDDKLDSEKSKQNEVFAGMEIEFIGSEDKSSEALNTDTPSTSERSTASNPTTTVDQPQKRLPRSSLDHPEETILGRKEDPIRTRASFRNSEESLMGLVSLIEPSSIDEALLDNDWILAMQEELNQFTRNDVWDLVPRPKGFNVIGTRWVFRNKLNEQGEVIRNKARLVAQGYSQQEGIDYTETFAPVARLESIRLLISFAVNRGITLYQMDVKSAFLNGYIEEEVYVHQPPGFENTKHPEHVFKLKKSLYGLKQAPRAWYERLSNFLLENEFTRGKVDTTLFCKTVKSDILVCQIYVDDIIFGSTNPSLGRKFAKCMQAEFEMSLMGELKFFLGIQINQTPEGTYIHQSKYIRDLLKKFDLSECKPSKIPMHPTCILEREEVSKKVEQKVYRGMIGSLLYLTASRPDILFSVCICARFQSDPRESHLTAVKRIFKYLKGTTNLGLFYRKSSDYSLVGYCDADFAGDRVERKSTSGSCQFLGENLISWSSKRQSTIALSTAEVEYIAAAGCSTQMLWMKSQLEDFQIFESNIPILCDNTSAICLSKNPILHSRAKHIEIKHHFIRDYIQKGILNLKFIDTDHQWADIFTKPLSEDRFNFILKHLSMKVCPE